VNHVGESPSTSECLDLQFCTMSLLKAKDNNNKKHEGFRLTEDNNTYEKACFGTLGEVQPDVGRSGPSP